MLSNFTGILKIWEILKEGKEIRKCKVDGKKVTLLSGRMQSSDSPKLVKITLSYKDADGATHNVEAVHSVLDDNHNTIKFDDHEVNGADVDLNVIWHGLSTDVKATLETTQDPAAPEIEVYAKVHSVL